MQRTNNFLILKSTISCFSIFIISKTESPSSVITILFSYSWPFVKKILDFYFLAELFWICHQWLILVTIHLIWDKFILLVPWYQDLFMRFYDSLIPCLRELSLFRFFQKLLVFFNFIFKNSILDILNGFINLLFFHWNLLVYCPWPPINFY